MRLEAPTATLETAARTIAPEVIASLSQAGEKRLAGTIEGWFSHAQTSNAQVLDSLGIRADDLGAVRTGRNYDSQPGWPHTEVFSGSQFSFLQKPSLKFKQIEVAANPNLSAGLNPSKFPKAFDLALEPDSRVVRQFELRAGRTSYLSGVRVPADEQLIRALMNSNGDMTELSHVLLKDMPRQNEHPWRESSLNLIVHSPGRSTTFRFFPNEINGPGKQGLFADGMEPFFTRQEFLPMAGKPV